ncbi:MAG: glycosyltransferase [Acidobacteriota bacterium]|nr:glycosyltransferase [Acidobacteriota bacterium]
MYHKLVTVIIPTYNRAQLVVEAIESVKAQSYPEIQIIVVDDGSQDNTAQSVAKFENVEYYYQENKGQAAVRNLGLSYAKGEYIASLDSDDIWHEDFLKVAVAALEKYEADFVFLNWTEIFETETLVSGWESSNKGQKYFNNSNDEWAVLNAKEVRELFFSTCPAPSSALLIRRSSFVKGWNEAMRIADDWCLILEMVVMKPCRAAFTLSRYWTKRVHSSNIYHGREELEIIRDLGLHDEPLIARLFQEQLSFNEKAVMKKRLASHYFNFGRLSLKRDGFSLKHLGSFATGFRLSPMGSVFYITQLSFSYLKKRLRNTRNKQK